MSSNINENYGRNFLNLKKFYNHITKQKRLEILNIINDQIDLKINKTLLDVGTTSSLESHDNLIIKRLYNHLEINCLSNLKLENLLKNFPKIKAYLQDARDMQFDDNSFDVVISNATIEHVGDFERQKKFISECLRVSKNKVIITTPNRYYPIEFHTRLPFLHMLPKNIHRKLLYLLGENFLSSVDNLNLISKKELSAFCKLLKIKNFEIKSIKLFGIKSNFILIINKI